MPGAPGIGASGSGTMNDISFYGSSLNITGGYNASHQDLVWPPIGAGDGDHYAGSIHLDSSMKIQGVSLDENGRLASNYNYNIFVKQKENAAPVYPVFTDCDETLGTVTTSLPMAHEGDGITFTATPKARCRLDSVTVTDHSGNPVTVSNGSFLMPGSSAVVKAVFLSNIYAVEVSQTGPGTVTAPETADMGETVALTVTPEAGCRLVSLTVTDSEGQAVEVSEDFEFTMPASAVAVAAEFEAVEQELRAVLSGAGYGSYTVAVNGGEPVSVSSDGSFPISGVRTGDTVTVTFSPAENGCVDMFYLEDSSYHEHNHISDILNDSYTFAMPAERTGIFTRFAPSSPTESVSCIDENGSPLTVEARVLTGFEQENYRLTSSGFYYYTPLGSDGDEPAWYVVKENVNYYHDKSFPRNIELNGDVRIIVADGATITVQSGISGGKLSIYGQTNGTGKLVSDSFSGSELNVCGAQYEVNTINSAGSALSVRNGSLTVAGEVSCGSLEITSSVTNIASLTIEEGLLTLSCADDDDRIFLGSIAFDDGIAKIADGQALTDYEREYTGTLFETDLAAMAGKTLRKAHAHDVATTTHHAAVPPANDPVAGSYINGNVEYYSCPICGWDFVENGGALERTAASELLVPYFRFRGSPIPGYANLCTIYEYNGTDADVVIPDTIPEGYVESGMVGRAVVSIDSEVFKDNTALTSVTAGDRLTGIYRSAFEGCTGLNTVTIGSGLKDIGTDAFKGCTALETFASTSTGSISYSHYIYESGPEESFDPGTGVVFRGPHGSALCGIAAYYECQFVPTDRHREPVWTWSADYSSAAAVFDCGGTCSFSGGAEGTRTDDDTEAIETATETEYTASVAVDGETYTESKKIYHWKALQEEISAKPDGEPSVIQLSRDVTAAADDVPIVIPAGKHIVIELQNHTIDRNLNEVLVDGNVFTNEGTLELIGRGTVTGGMNIENGGAIINNGTLNLTNVTIKDNLTTKDGGAIYNSGTLNMNGGELSMNSSVKSGGAISAHAGTITINSGRITRNMADSNGGAIYIGSRDGTSATLNLYGGTITGNVSKKQGGGICNGGTLNVSGRPVVKDNSLTGNDVNKGYNVYLYDDSGSVISSKISVTGPLTDGAKIGVTKAGGSNGVFASGLSDTDAAAGFSSDKPDYVVGVNTDGEAFLGVPATVTFASGLENADGSMASVTLASGSAYMLPACGFTVEDSVFSGWSVTVGNAEAVIAQPNDVISVASDTTVSALWQKAAAPVFIAFDANGGEGGMDAAEPDENGSYSLPANGFTAPEGMEFAGWLVGGEILQPGEAITVAGDTVVTAQWQTAVAVPAEEEAEAETEESGNTPEAEQSEEAESAEPEAETAAETEEPPVFEKPEEAESAEPEAETAAETEEPPVFEQPEEDAPGAEQPEEAESAEPEAETAAETEEPPVSEQPREDAHEAETEQQADEETAEEKPVEPAAAYTVTFDGGGADGEMEPVQAAGGSLYVLPDAGYSLEGAAFDSWEISGNDGTFVAKAGDAITVSGDVTATALWLFDENAVTEEAGTEPVEEPAESGEGAPENELDLSEGLSLEEGSVENVPADAESGTEIELEDAGESAEPVQEAPSEAGSVFGRSGSAAIAAVVVLLLAAAGVAFRKKKKK